jgi:hypothetical protein
MADGAKTHGGRGRTDSRSKVDGVGPRCRSKADGDRRPVPGQTRPIEEHQGEETGRGREKTHGDDERPPRRRDRARRRRTAVL